MDILLDTNFCLIPVQYNIDIFAEINRIIDGKFCLITLSSVIDELDGLSGNSRDGVAAKVALKLIEDRKILVIDSKGYADDAIVSHCLGTDTIVATNDRGLKMRLKEQGIKFIFMRSKSHLQLNK